MTDLIAALIVDIIIYTWINVALYCRIFTTAFVHVLFSWMYVGF